MKRVLLLLNVMLVLCAATLDAAGQSFQGGLQRTSRRQDGHRASG